MRILVVNKFYWAKGGSERVMLDLARGYESAGHEVIPFAMASPANRETPWAEYFVPEVDYSARSPVARLRAAVRVLHSGVAARRIRRLIHATRPHVAHLHNFHHQLSPSIVDVLREEGVGAVHTLHDYKVICPNYLLYTGGEVCERCKGGRFHPVIRHRCVRASRSASVVAFLEMTWHRHRRTLERGIRRVISPSRFLVRKLVEFGMSAERVSFVPNGLDPEAFRAADRPGDGFLYVGRLSREKGLGTLVAAVASRPDLRLTIAGDGPEEHRVRRDAERLAPGRVDFPGYLERRDLFDRIRGARAVVLPSEWYENAPIAALEACASGVPVVGARIGGIPEIVRDGETGLLFDSGDAEGLAEGLSRLQRDPELAHRMGRRGREVLEGEYSLAGQIRSMLSILEEVASSASR
jgi:glycosyltransferase involved in cell wall biosynthesis